MSHRLCRACSGCVCVQLGIQIAQEDIALNPPPTEKIVESAHDYANNTDQIFKVSLPGAEKLRITFDARSRTEAGCDYLVFRSRRGFTSPNLSGTSFPGMGAEAPLVIDGDSCEITWHTDGSNTAWGWRAVIEGVMPPKPASVRCRVTAFMTVVSTRHGLTARAHC